MPQETKQIHLEWRQDLQFVGGESGGPEIVIDGDNTLAPGPMLLLLMAAASCSAADIVLILTKMRVELSKLRIEAAGVRQETEPRRYVSIELRYQLAGAGLDEAKARRAIELSIDKYCSVMHTLSLDQPISYVLEID